MRSYKLEQDVVQLLLPEHFGLACVEERVGLLFIQKLVECMRQFLSFGFIELCFQGFDDLVCLRISEPNSVAAFR